MVIAPFKSVYARIIAMESATNVLTNSETARYSRQLILPEIGPQGQAKLKSTGVLIVGAGGLGCPAAIYLAAAGIGKLGIVDYDEVELGNLHRQILHTEKNIGISKAKSVIEAVQNLNSAVECCAYEFQLTSKNALSVIEQYDIVVDATDNVPTRYLLNDACVLAKKPLVSGSALRFEGQLTVYNYGNGPCYRCIYPVPPSPEMVTNCSDGGVLGAVPGVIGTLQAIEVLKCATGLEVSFCSQMLIFDGLRGNFRKVKLRSKKANCIVCGTNPTLTRLIDYEQFCGTRATDKAPSVTLLSDEERMSCSAYKTMVDTETPHLLVDVREPVELDICKLPRSFNIPFRKLDHPESIYLLKTEIEKIANRRNNEALSVIVVCRRGNDSQLAVKSLQIALEGVNVDIKDLSGGLHAWTSEVDPDFPVY